MAKKNHKSRTEQLWEEFELIIGSIFQHHFNYSGIKFERTNLRSDGGKDGIAEIELFRGDALLSDTRFRIWLEVKYRTGKGNLNEYDIGGNVVIALLEHVHGLYVVSNRAFTTRAMDGIKALGHRLNCDIHFIGKEELVYFLNQHTPSDINISRLRQLLELTPDEIKRLPAKKGAHATAKKSGRYKIRIRFVGSIDSPPTKIPAREMSLRQGEFCFVTVDVWPERSFQTVSPTLEVESNAPERLEIFSYHAWEQSPFSPDGYQNIYMFLPKESGPIVLGDQYTISLRSVLKPQIEWECDQTVQVKSRLNCEWLPKSWGEATHPLLQAMDHWLDVGDGGFVSSNIIAAAGYGKSFLARKIRHDALHVSSLGNSSQPNILAVLIDCEAVNNPQDMVSALFTHLLAGDPASSLILDKEGWRLVLESVLGLSSNASNKFIDWLRTGRDLDDGERISRRDAVTVAALLLRNVSRKRKLLLIVEDLHKTDPDTFQFLLELRAHLERSGDSELFLIFTSRWEKSLSATKGCGPFHGSGKPDKALVRWTESFDTMLSGVNERHNIYLSPFEWRETIQLLRKTVNGLSNDAANAIVAQVGTDPFSLREALLFWEMSSEDTPRSYDMARCGGALTRLPNGNGYRLDYPENLALEKIETPNLSRATRERLRIARSHSPYVADLLDHGACLGSSFSYEAVEQILLAKGGADQGLLDEGYDYCHRFDLLREDPFRPSKCEFAHDLLRSEAINTMAKTRHRRIAASFLDKHVYQSPLEQAELCYQAGRREEQFQLTRQILARGDATARARLVAALLQVLALDTTTKWDLLPRLPFLDWNVAVVPPEERDLSNPFRPSSDTALLLDSYQSAIRSMRTITGASNELWERLATAGAMLAAENDDTEKVCLFNYYSGRHLYDHMEFAKALELLEDAERIYGEAMPVGDGLDESFISRLLGPEMADEEIVDWVSREGPWVDGPENEDRRQENLFYISFAQRHLDNSGGFFHAMRRALALRRPGQWRAIGQAMANTGALYLHRDLEETWRYWHRGLQIMTQCDYKPYRIEFIINLGHLAMLLGRDAEAEGYLRQGLDLAKHNEQKGQEIRAYFHQGCLAMLRENWPVASKLLDTTMEAALTNSYHRRFWRIRANAASLHEVQGNLQEAAHYDRLCVQKMAPVTDLGGADGEQRLLWQVTRASCALGNIGLRRLHHPSHYLWFEGVLTTQQKWVAEHLAQAIGNGQLEALHGLRHFLVRLNGRERFLVTD